MDRVSKCVTSKAIQLFKFAIFALLFIAAFLCAELIIQQFLEGSTYVSTTQTQVSKDDLPTVTICFLGDKDFVYGSDFEIQTLANYTNCESSNGNCENTTLISLIEGKNEYAFQPGRKDLTFLRKLKVQNRHAAHPFRTCIAIDMSLREKDSEIDNEGIEGYSFNDVAVSVNLNVGKLEYYNLGFVIVCFFDKVKPEDVHEVTVYFTTRRNSYGAAYFQWYDGDVSPFKLEKGTYTTVNIIQINRHEYLAGTCQHTSFYECLGSKIKSEVSCSTYSLPNGDSMEDLPICQSPEKQKECDGFRKIALDQCMEQKPCIVQEYVEKLDPLWSGYDKNSSNNLLRLYLKESVVDTILQNQDNKYMIWPAFTPRRTKRGKYSRYFSIDVHKEYLAVTGTSLVGNVGGQLGLFVGFSFTGFIAWMFDLFPKVKSVFTRLKFAS